MQKAEQISLLVVASRSPGAHRENQQMNRSTGDTGVQREDHVKDGAMSMAEHLSERHANERRTGKP